MAKKISKKSAAPTPKSATKSAKPRTVASVDKGKASFDLIMSALKKDKHAAYADIAAKAAKKGMTIYPIMFGRAKLLLGLVKQVDHRPAVRTKAAPVRAAARVRRTASTSSAPDLASLTSAIEKLGRMEEALDEIRRIVDGIV